MYNWKERLNCTSLDLYSLSCNLVSTGPGCLSVMGSLFPSHLGLCCVSLLVRNRLPRLHHIHRLEVLCWHSISKTSESALLTLGMDSFMPHVILAVFGVIAGRVLLKENRRNQLWFVAIMALIFITSLSQLDFMQFFTYPDDPSAPFGRRDYKATYKVWGGNGIEQVWGIIQGEKLRTSVKTYYNYTATTIPLLMSLAL